MITGTEVLSNLKTIKKKVDFLEITYPSNTLWPEVNKQLENLISLINRDLKTFGYD